MINHRKRASKVWPILARRALNKDKPLTYGGLCNKIGLHPRSARYFLSVIQIYCKKRNLPPLQALVVNKKTGVPGKGYIGSGRSQKEHREALKKVYSYEWPTKAPVFQHQIRCHTLRTPLVPSNRLDEFVELLSQLPPATWKATMTEGSAGWKWMQPFSNTWVFGHFATLFIILGLNDYQLKGKAEVAYWPKVVPLIPINSDPEEPLKLIGLLEPFYDQERMAKAKVERLHRFLSSEFCSKIWGSDSASIAADFGRIWHALGRTMSQNPEKKTIAFAMKCLALALLMVDETMFDFGAIPVPVDSRILSISTRLGLPHVNEQAERERWQQVLERVREVNPKVTMVHLDSLLWQIGTLSKDEMQTHLATLGAGSLASRITEMIFPQFSGHSVKLGCHSLQLK